MSREDKIKKRNNAVIKGMESLFFSDPDKLTAEILNEKNNSQLSKKLEKRYLVSSNDYIKVETFIIPVSDGAAVTGYYFVNTRISEISGSVPLIVYFHGGGWVMGNMQYYSVYLKHLAEETEANILLVDYRLAPKFKFPTAVEDCYDAFVWASGGSKYWKVDPDRIFVAGDEAGGNLAAVVALLARDRKGPPIAGQILLYPIVDCRLRTSSMVAYKDNPFINEKMLSFFVKNYEREPKDILSPMFSPLLSQDLSRLPDALIIAAEYDPLSDDARLYASALKEAGSSSTLCIAEGSINGFMPFKKGIGRRRAEGAIWQLVSGRTIESIQFLNRKELKNYKHTIALESKATSASKES